MVFGTAGLGRLHKPEQTLHNFERLIVSSKRGEARARAKITENIQAGQVFMPMHYEQTNDLTVSSFDPYSRQPSYKYAAVSIKEAASQGDAL